MVSVTGRTVTVSWLDPENEAQEIPHPTEPVAVWVDTDGVVGGIRRRFAAAADAARIAGDYRARARFATPDGADAFLDLVDRRAKRRYKGSIAIGEPAVLISLDAEGVPIELEFEDRDRIPAAFLRR